MKITFLMLIKEMLMQDIYISNIINKKSMFSNKAFYLKDENNNVLESSPYCTYYSNEYFHKFRP